MSANFYVLPGSSPGTIAEVRKKMVEWLSSHTNLSTEVEFVCGDREVGEGEEEKGFSVKEDEVYSIDYSGEHTTLALERNQFYPDIYSVRGLLRDLNVTEIEDSDVDRVESGHREFGYFSIHSHAGRSGEEKYILQALLVALAEVSMGWVAVWQEVFDIGKGVFGPDDVSSARWSWKSLPRLKKLDARTAILQCDSMGLFRQVPRAPEIGGGFQIKKLSSRDSDHEVVLESDHGLFCDGSGSAWVYGISLEGQEGAVIVGTDCVYWISGDLQIRRHPLNRAIDTISDSMEAMNRAISHPKFGVLLCTRDESLRISSEGDEVWRRENEHPPLGITEEGIWFGGTPGSSSREEHALFDACTGETRSIGENDDVNRV